MFASNCLHSLSAFISFSKVNRIKIEQVGVIHHLFSSPEMKNIFSSLNVTEKNNVPSMKLILKRTVNCSGVQQVSNLLLVDLVRLKLPDKFLNLYFSLKPLLHFSSQLSPRCKVCETLWFVTRNTAKISSKMIIQASGFAMVLINACYSQNFLVKIHHKSCKTYISYKTGS